MVHDDVDESAGDGSSSDENDDDDDNDDDPNHMIHMDPDDDVTSSEDTAISQHSEDIQNADDEDDENSHALPSQQTGVGLMPSTAEPVIIEGLASKTTGVDEPWDNPTVEVECTGVDDYSVARDSHQPNEEEKFAEAVAAGQADDMKPNTV